MEKTTRSKHFGVLRASSVPFCPHRRAVSDLLNVAGLIVNRARREAGDRWSRKRALDAFEAHDKAGVLLGQKKRDVH